MLTVLGIAFGVVGVLLITALTGYFVAQEFGYMSVDRSRLTALAEGGDAGAARALTVTRRTSFMLSGAQLGITVTGLLVGYVAEPLIGRGLGELLGGIGIPTAVGIGVGTVLAITFCTIIQMLFGELIPKNFAIARPEPVACWLARSTALYLKVFGPIIWVFDQSSNLVLKVMRIEPVHDVEHSATRRDLEHIVAASRDSGELPQDLSNLLDRILDFPTRTAEHAMVPRAQLDTVQVEDPVNLVLEQMGVGHTRYPVLGSSSDDLRGVIHLHDLLDLHIDEVERILGYRLPAGDFETLAGAVIARFAGFPGLGDIVAISLQHDAADLVGDGEPVTRELVADVREIDNYVPSSLFVTLAVHEAGSADE